MAREAARAMSKERRTLWADLDCVSVVRRLWRWVICCSKEMRVEVSDCGLENERPMGVI